MTDQQQMIWLTVLLVVFAAAQAAFTWWGGKIQRLAAEAEADRRLKEWNRSEVQRQREERREWDMARRLATTETIRLSLLLTRLIDSEQVELGVAASLFDAKDFRVAEPAVFARNMTVVGPEAGDLSTMVITMCDDFATRLLSLTRVVQASAPSGGIAKLRELNSIAQVTRPIVLELRTTGRELKALIDDANRQCLPSDPGRRRFRGQMSSALGKAYQGAWETPRPSSPSK